jgi:hypothetical protein
MCEHPIAPWQHVDGGGEVKPYRAPLLVQSMGNAAPQGQGEANGAVLVVLHEESAGLELKFGVPILERKPRWFWDKRRLLSQPFQKPPPASPSALLQASTSASRRPFQSIAAVQHSPVLRWFSGCAAEDDVTAQPLSTPDRPCSFPETHPSEASPLASHPFTTALRPFFQPPPATALSTHSLVITGERLPCPPSLLPRSLCQPSAVPSGDACLTRRTVTAADTATLPSSHRATQCRLHPAHCIFY